MNFEILTLKELVRERVIEIKTGPFGTQLKASDYVSEGIPVVNVRNIGFGNIVDEKLERISKATAQRLSAHLLATDDIVFGRKGAVERHAFIGESCNGWLQGSDCIRLRVLNRKKVLPRYLSYFFLTTEHKNRMMSLCSHGSTMASLNQSILDVIEIPHTSIENQEAIVSMLTPLDDNIELNNRIITNLETQAQAIFKSWFVDFEPFQDGEFEESELGLIPKGWRVGTLKDICHYSNDRVAVETLNDETYISTENMLPNKQGFVKAASLPTTAYTTAYHVGDVLISNIRPYFKKIVYCYGEGGCSTDVICFVGNDGFPPEYLFHLLYNDAFFDFMVGGSKGTKMPRGDKQQLMQYPVALPDSKWIVKFEKTVQPMLLHSYTLKQENERLAQIRDTLLPKLMSGEIEVSVEG